MRTLSVGLIAIVASLVSAPLFAQDDSGPVTSKDILERRVPPHRIQPAPQSGNILIQFGDYARVYFRRPVKSIKLGDDLTVRATPETDHVIRFDALSPGETSLTIEDDHGTESKLAIITVSSEPHVVRIYGHHGRARKDTNEATKDSPNFAGYMAIECNEIRCGPIPAIEKGKDEE